MPKDLSATQAAARLGIKKATLYAYVSRGMIGRRAAPDGRTSLFDADEIEAFRTRRRRSPEGELDAVVATAITEVADDDVRVRGRSLVGMVAEGSTFATIVDWLWESENEPWELSAPVEAAVGRAQRAMPDGTPLIDRLRATAAVVSATDPLRFDRSPRAVRASGRALLLAMARGLPRLRAGSARHGRKTRAARDRAREPLAEALWPRLTTQRRSGDRAASLNAALGLLVDHGLASSTLAARVAASVRADPYSIVVTGLGVLGGSLHGAASAGVHRLLADADRLGDPALAVGDAHRRLGAIPGTGHAVYVRGDPRHAALLSYVERGWGADDRLELVRSVEELLVRRTAIVNVDFALGALTWLAKMPPSAGEAIFAISRTAGWIAHGLEEYGEQPLRFRPKARYTGPRGG